jgi:hyperosmotically inducible protein
VNNDSIADYHALPVNIQNSREVYEEENMRTKLLSLLCVAVILFVAACGKSDADLTKAVNAKLAADGVTGVTATVNNGVATLTGEVADVTVKAKAALSAKSVDGVKSVTDNTTVKPLPVATPAAPDQALLGKITENLKKANCGTAVVTVNNGKVTVTGAVPDAKYAECIQIIQQAGITGIDNQLKKGS